MANKTSASNELKGEEIAWKEWENIPADYAKLLQLDRRSNRGELYCTLDHLGPEQDVRPQAAYCCKLSFGTAYHLRAIMHHVLPKRMSGAEDAKSRCCDGEESCLDCGLVKVGERVEHVFEYWARFCYYPGLYDSRRRTSKEVDKMEELLMTFRYMDHPSFKKGVAILPLDGRLRSSYPNNFVQRHHGSLDYPIPPIDFFAREVLFQHGYGSETAFL